MIWHNDNEVFSKGMTGMYAEWRKTNKARRARLIIFQKKLNCYDKIPWKFPDMSQIIKWPKLPDIFQNSLTISWPEENDVSLIFSWRVATLLVPETNCGNLLKSSNILKDREEQRMNTKSRHYQLRSRIYWLRAFQNVKCDTKAAKTTKHELIFDPEKTNDFPNCSNFHLCVYNLARFLFTKKANIDL